jgi:hypothetical protein
VGYKLNGKSKLIIFNLCLSAICAFAQQRHNAQITVHVSDDASNAISGITIAASTFWRSIPGEGSGSDEDKIVTGKTDTNGFVTLSIPCAVDDGTVSMEVAYGIQVPLTGYYSCSSGEIIFTNIIADKWQPWNPTLEVVLQKIGVQVPMYARRFWESKMPAENKPCGFDLMVGDWVAPYGKGEISDFIFQLDRGSEGIITNRYGHIRLYDNKLTINFSNDGDGIQPLITMPHSGLKSPRLAPLEGYQPTLVKRDALEKVTEPTPHEKEFHITERTISDYQKDANYFFMANFRLSRWDEKSRLSPGRLELQFQQP